MASFQQPSPLVNLDNSPAESFLSAPGDTYTSLFAATTPSTSATMNPMEIMTPKSVADDKQASGLEAVLEEDDDDESTTTPSSDKKPTKKRKSWGQVLPEPKTNLPPRKRAKTDDEKEQRRVERVLRNRRAAQSSRERKRLEVEALEKRNQELESMLINAQKANLILVEELNRFRRSSGVVTRSSSPLDSLRDSPVTLSQQLFGSQNELKATADQSAANTTSSSTSLENIMMSSTNPTVNPASLSPELLPVSDADEQTLATESAAQAQAGELTETTSPDLTQHPAAMLSDLQCHKSAEMSQSLPASLTSTPLLLAWSLQLRMLLLSASAILSACQRPLTQIAMSSKAGFSLLPSPQILTTIIWLVTLPPASRTSTSSTSTTSSTTTQPTPPQTLWQRAMAPRRSSASTTRSTTLRLKSLRKILSSSPNLARPLMDATMVALRLVSEGRDDRVGNQCGEAGATRDAYDQLTKCLRSIVLPSKEVLVTLLWALKVEERRVLRRSSNNSSHALLPPESGALSPQHQPNQKYVLKIAGAKRRRRDLDAGSGSKRYRLM